jgi:NTP pyrophosphatase (non-canonical NTP hydrolase)
MGKINTTNFKSVPLDVNGWMDFFNEIFEIRNRQFRKAGNENARFMWLKVMEHSTRIAEAIRKREFFDAVSSVARVFCWICGFVKNNAELLGTEATLTPLADIIWHKYPRVCAYCVPPLTGDVKEIIDRRQGLSCSCEPRERERERNKKAVATYLDEYRKLKRPISLDDWSDMIIAIYGQRCSLTSLESICFHFLEEVGEVLTMMQMIASFHTNFPRGTPIGDIKRKIIFKEFFKDLIYRRETQYDDFVDLMKTSLRDEIADVLSWLFSLVEKLFSERASFSTYERNVRQLLEKNRDLRAFSGVIGYDILRSLPSKDEKERVLSFASIAFVFYAGGCPVCKNFERDIAHCECDLKIPSTFILSDRQAR